MNSINVAVFAENIVITSSYISRIKLYRVCL